MEQESEIITHSSGLQYQDLRAGEGVQVQAGDTIAVHYVGRLEDGTQFDSSIDRGEPFSLVIGTGSVIQGWDIGVPGMKVGGIRRLIIPPDLGYGTAGVPGAIPPNATLIFEVQVLEIAQK
jgi:FKBP-type peptidyl-prolyl cis-trans isomerase